MSTIRDAVEAVDGVSIGGSGTWGIRFPEDLSNPNTRVIEMFEEGFETPWGQTIPFKLLEVNGGRILRVAFHGVRGWPSQQGIWRCALQVAHIVHEVQAPWAIVDASVGGIQKPNTNGELLPPWSIVVPDDFHWRDIPVQFLEESAAITSTLLGCRGAARLGKPIHPDLRFALLEAAKQHFENVYDGGSYVCTGPGPFETAAAIEEYRRLGHVVVGRTFAYEALLARVYGYPIAAVNIIVNWAEGKNPNPEWTPGGMKAFYQKCGVQMGKTTVAAIEAILEQGIDSSFGQEYAAKDLSMFPVKGA